MKFNYKNILSFIIANCILCTVLFAENNISLTLQSELDNSNNSILSSLTDIDFSFVRPNEIASKQLWLSNDGVDEIEIERVKIIGYSGNIFSVIASPGLPAFFKPGEKLKLTINFSPLQPTTYFDSLLIDVVYPFKFHYHISLRGYSYLRTSVSIPDSSAIVGLTNYKVPIFAGLIDKYNIYENFGYRIKIQFDAKSFTPVSSSQGKIITDYVIGEKRIIEIEDNNISLFSNNFLLNEIIGTVLLGKKDKTFFEILEFNWNVPWLISETKNGSLNISGICSPNLSQIRTIENKNITVYPVPSNNILNVEYNPKINFDYNLNIYSIDGKIQQISSNNSFLGFLKENNVIKIDISNLTSGTYFLVFEKPYEQFSISFSVFK